MTPAEWNATADTTSPDLFGGELFGDELIDLYHSAEGDLMETGTFHKSVLFEEPLIASIISSF